MKHMCPQDCDLVLQFHRSSVIAALSRDSLFRCMCPDRRPVLLGDEGAAYITYFLQYSRQKWGELHRALQAA
jgi:hypothetical protein